MTNFILTEDHIAFLNSKLENLPPAKIIEWAIVTLPGLFQTTAFGLTGIAITDMISELGNSEFIPLIFINTLYHFQDTLDLVSRVQARYGVKINHFTPKNTVTQEEFVALYGDRLWEQDQATYDFLTKVEPAQRAYEELKVKAVFTGRRRSQKGARTLLPIIEVDSSGLIKVNPLATWSFNQVEEYIKERSAPFNPLLAKGYLSIGDIHSTVPALDRSDERSGRWAGQPKTECGIHQDYFKLKKTLIQPSETSS